jgi:flagellar biogenesis protein FliO
MGPPSLQEPAATVETPLELLQAPAPPESGRRLLKSAEEASPKIGDRARSEPGLTGVFLATLVVLALLAGTFLLLRRLLRASKLFSGPGAIRVLARRTVAPKQDVLLVEVGSRVLVVGAARDALTRLGEITSGEEVAQIRARCGVEREAPAFRAPKAEEEPGTGGAAESESAPIGGGFRAVVQELSRIRAEVRGWKEEGA